MYYNQVNILANSAQKKKFKELEKLKRVEEELFAIIAIISVDFMFFCCIVIFQNI